MNNLEVILTNEQITKRIKKLAEDLCVEYKNKDLVVIGIINGSIYFLTDLTQNMNIDLQIDLMGVSSYRNSNTNGDIKITKDLSIDIKDKDVLIVEDIIDTGSTFEFLNEYFKQKGAKSIKMISLLIKEKSLKNKEMADEILFTVPNDFLVGYGLDYANNYRHLKDICKVQTD